MNLKKTLVPLILSGLVLTSCNFLTPSNSKSKSKDEEEGEVSNPSLVKGHFYVGTDVKETSDPDYEKMKAIAKGSTVYFYDDGLMKWEATKNVLASSGEIVDVDILMTFNYEQKGSLLTYVPISSAYAGYTYELDESEKETYTGEVTSTGVSLETRNLSDEPIHMLFKYAGDHKTQSSDSATSSTSEHHNSQSSDSHGNSSSPNDNRIKIGLICIHDENLAYDKNFIDAFMLSANEMGYIPVLRTGISESEECYYAARDLVKEGCKAVIANSYGHESFLVKAAKEYPDVSFYHCSGTQAMVQQLDNYRNFYTNIYEGRYLAGYAVGLRIKEMINNGKISNPENGIKVGYVGSFNYAEVISQYTAWYLGIKEVVPSVTMDVRFAQSWYDPTAEESIALDLINNHGVVAIAQHSESTAVASVCEARRVLHSSYTISTQDTCPNTFVSYCRSNYEMFFNQAYEAVAIGRATPEGAYDYLSTLQSGMVEYGVSSANDQDRVEAVALELIEGIRKVFDCSKFTVNNGEHLTSYLADVIDDGNFTPDTNVIKNENGITYFAESDFRSAPYFNVAIDGINLLNVAY